MCLMSITLRTCLLFRLLLHISCEEGEGGATAQSNEEDGVKKVNPLSDDNLRQAHTALDENHDNEASRKELLTFAEKHQRDVDLDATSPEGELARKDVSKDGLVSLEEHLQDVENVGDVTSEPGDLERTKAMETEKFQAADTNGDGVLEKQELPALISPKTHERVQRVVAKHSMLAADRDNNGKIDLEEFEASPLMDDYKDNYGRFAGNTSEPLNGHEAEDLKISEDLGEGEDFSDILENKRAAKKLFKRLDKNGDGVLETEELQPLMSGRIEHEYIVDTLVKTLDKDSDRNIDSGELIQGKSAVMDSDIQAYLMSWAKHRQAIPIV